MTGTTVREAVAGRLQQARTALDDASFLLAGNRSPQSVVNRAYYAMFYAALALLETVGKVPSKHAGVISLFDTQFVLKGELPKELSKDFHRAFEIRQASDYRILEPCSTNSASETLDKATKFVGAVADYLGKGVVAL
jgi:uncharacterized protein